MLVSSNCYGNLWSMLTIFGRGNLAPTIARPCTLFQFLSICCLFYMLTLSIYGFPAVADVTSVTASEGITVTFTLPPLQVTKGTTSGSPYDTISYKDCGWLTAPGHPKMPVTRVLLGVPTDIQLSSEDISVQVGPVQTRSGIRLQAKGGKTVNRSQPAAAYPTTFASIETDGYIRSQRVISLALYPVQYHVARQEVRAYQQLTVVIRFRSSSGHLYSMSTETSLSSLYEPTLARLLLNYEAARAFRQPGLSRISAAPAAPSAPEQHQTRYKIAVDKTGIYRLTAAGLRDTWGVDLLGIDPRRLRITRAGQDIPIHISGTSDNRFDATDALFFLAHGSTDPESPFPKNAYTRWSVYWLHVSPDSTKTVAARIPLQNAGLGDATAVQVPTFRSRIIFEEDHLTNNLEFVHPKTGPASDIHRWFDALDFWYWAGIKNAADVGELRLPFKVYDLAKSFEPPEIHVVLQGGTPVRHEILAAVNGIRIGDLARWDYQEQTTVSKQLRAWNNFKDASAGDTNILSLTRIDTTFEEDTTRYPYHIYLNRFWVEYTRLFMAVDDQLRFASPTKPGEGRNHQYRIDAFLNPNISVFETDGKRLTARLTGVHIGAQPTDAAMNARLLALGSGDQTAVPNHTYTVMFQVPDTRSAKYIAVSETALRAPVRVEAVPPVDVRSAANSVDYLILTHPKFQDAADRLATWRGGSSGGGYRTKVVDINTVYNSFGDGTVHPQWIKAFLKHAYQNWAPPALSYVVLFGDGTYDFRGIDTDFHPEPPEMDGYIPTHYIPTATFGRTAADHWYATVSGHDEFVDFYLGRISVETEAEADAVVQKIIQYESKRPNGDWRRKIVSVADDEVNNSGDFIFKKSLDEIAKNHTLLGYETVEIFLEDVIDEVEANPDKHDGQLPQRVARERITTALGEGAVIAQYAGHGGRIVWAHEAIFDNAAVEKLQETGGPPFMLVLSCYNGYFDAPGEPSLAEKLFRKARGGIIGMLSATRLTYGDGNDALNRIIFSLLFKRDVRQLGPLTFDAKLEYLLTEGTSQLDIMMEYTLFGDPAMRIAMADYEIRPEIRTKTVKAGDTLKIAPGFIQNVRYDPIAKRKVFKRNTHFNGDLTVKAVFPGKHATGIDKTGVPKEFYTGDVLVTKTVAVRQGSYPAVDIAVPHNISPGDAHVEYYGENATEIAVGGDGFTVNVPKILDIRPELVSKDTLTLAVQVSDDKNLISTVEVEWRNPKTHTWEKVSLQPVETVSDTGARWWHLREPLPVPTDGRAFRYEIQVTDTDGHTVISDIHKFYPYLYPNLSVVFNRDTKAGHIYYTLKSVPPGASAAAYQWHLSADIEMAGHDETDSAMPSVNVAFFHGNPDKDEDAIIDTDAHLIGEIQLTADDWTAGNPLVDTTTAYTVQPLNTNPIATASIPIALRGGTYDVFVYVDPIFNTADTPGALLENDETDNIGYRQLTVASQHIGEVPTQIDSLDGGLRLRVPAVAIGAQRPAVLTVQPIASTISAPLADGTWEQNPNLPANGLPANTAGTALLSPVVLPGGRSRAQLAPTGNSTYTAITGYKLQVDSGADTLPTAVTFELDFDMETIRQQVVQEHLGGDESDTVIVDPVGTIIPEENITAGIVAHTRSIGAYLYLASLANWVKLPTTLKETPNGDIQTTTRVTQIRVDNISDSRLTDVLIDPDGAEIGHWTILFETEYTYRVLFRPEDAPKGSPLQQIATQQALPSVRFGQSEMEYGWTLDIRPGETPFQFGDIFHFRIAQFEIPDETPNAPVKYQIYAASFKNQNAGNGAMRYLTLDQRTGMPIDEWLLLFVNNTEFQIEGKKTGTLKTADETPIYGTVGETFTYPEYGLTLHITQGTKPFVAGDRFLFKTATVGTITGTTAFTGTLTCLRSDDTLPPEIQLTIGNQQHFKSGDPVDAAPLIQATLTDERGIDYITRPIQLSLGTFGAFEPIPQTEYRLTQHKGSTQLILTYQSPKLEPREYQVRLTASDLDGNSAENDISFRVHGTRQLQAPLNYPNPFPKETTITCELTQPADALTLKIYTVTGRLIRELETDAPAGFIMLKWDGADSNGTPVANGVYYGKINVKGFEGEGDQTHILKMMKLK